MIAMMKKTPTGKTDTVRLDAELVRWANVIATVEGISVSDVVSPILRPVLAKRFDQAVKELNRQREAMEK